MKMNILITGGAGFVGSNLAVFLKDRLKDTKVICLDNLSRKGSQLNVQRLKARGIDFLQMDIRQKEQLLKLPSLDIIIDCCAEPSVLAAYDDPQYTIDTNLIGTINTLELAKRDSAGFIFLSSSRVYPVDKINQIPYEENETRLDWKKDVYGQGYSNEGIAEDFSLIGVKSLYGATKLCSEQIATEYFDMYGLKGVINRFGIIAGPWQMSKIDQGLLGYWVAQHVFDGSLSYIGYKGEGKQVRDTVHIDDLCELILFEITHLKKVDRELFNAGGGRDNSFSLCELTGIVQQITDKKIPIACVFEERKSDIRIYISDNSYVYKKTGWKPRKNVEDIVIDIDQWMAENRCDLENIFMNKKSFVSENTAEMEEKLA